MFRYKLLLQRALDPQNKRPPSMRDLSRQFGFPVTTLYSYVQLDAIPRPENMGKMAEYFNETISSLFSDDDDLTAALVARIRELPEQRKEHLLREL